MEQNPFNTFDIIILSILLMSSMVAFFRGFIREMLSLVAWISAAVITFFTFEQAAVLLEPYISKPILAKGAAAVGVFLIALIGVSIINIFIVKAAKKADIGPLDRSLGFAFGLARGAFIVSVGFMLYSMVTGLEEKPDWLAEAKTGKLVEIGAKAMLEVAPELTDDVEEMTSTIRNKLDTGDEEESKGPVATLMDREAFKVLTSEDTLLLNNLIDGIPENQMPQGLQDVGALETTEASNLLANLIRLQKQLARKPGNAPLSTEQEKRLTTLEDKLVYIYTQSRSKPGAKAEEPTRVPAAPPISEDDSGYTDSQLKDKERLFQAINE